MRKTIIGSISHGTTRPEDLIPCLLDTLKTLRSSRYYELKRNYPEIWESMEKEEYSGSDYFLNEVLSDALNDYAPDYFYFGIHPGDGTDWGFWPYENLSEDFDGLKVNDLSEVPKDYRGEVLYVNDHGNTSLYVKTARKLKEIWSIV